jgi:AcrR family transcriptional regulator
MTRQAATADRIAEAALRLFTVHGYAGASMEQVRREAGVSNGSLYHHFGSRAELAAHLLVTGMASSQQVVVRGLGTAEGAEEGVREVVRAVLIWVQEHPQLARLLYGDLPDEVLQAAEPAFSQQNRRYVQVVGGWLSDQAERGGIVPRPFGVAHALWLGPAQEFARHWLRGRSRISPSDAAADLAEGAWRALAAR